MAIVGKLWAKRWVKVLLGLVAVVTLLVVLLPVGTKYYLTDWLRKNGADQARIETLRLNPFLGRITMEGVDVQRDGQSLLRNARMVLDLDLLSLLQRDVHVEKAEYRDLLIDIEQRADGSWRFGSYSMTGGAETQSEAADNDAASSWAVLADQVALTDCRVRLKTPQMDLVLAVEQAELLRFSTREGRPSASFMLTGLLNDAPLAIDLERVELVPELQIDGAVTISGFHLEAIAGLLEDTLPTFAGGISLAGDVSFGQTAETGMHAAYDGTFTADAAAVGAAGFSTAARSLSWQGRVDYSGTDDDGLTVLVDGDLTGADYDLQLPDVPLDMTLSRIEVGGRIELTVADQGRITAHHREGAIRLEGFGLNLPQLELSEERLVWQGETRYDSDNQGRGMLVRSEGGLELGALQSTQGGDSSSVRAGIDALSWQGMAAYGKQGANASQIDVDGMLSVAGVEADFEQSALRVTQERVEVRAESSVSLGEEPAVTGHHEVLLDGFVLAGPEQPLVTIDTVRIGDIEGRGELKLAANDLQVGNVQATVSGSLPLQVAVEHIEVPEMTSAELAEFAVGEVRLEKATATATRSGEILMRLGGLVAQDIAGTDRQRIDIDRTTLERLVVLPSSNDSSEQAVLTLEEAALDGLSWSEATGVQGTTLHLTDLIGSFVREPNGSFVLARRLADMQEPAGDVAAEQPVAGGREHETERAPFSLDMVLIDGDSRISLTDYTLPSPFTTNLAIDRLEVGRFDTASPDLATAIELQGESEGRAPVKLSGTIAPFLHSPAADLRLNLKNYPLSALSPYTVQAVGTALASGQLRLESELSLADEQLQLDNAVLLQQLQIETITPSLAEELDNQLPVPLDAALSLLRDDDGNIELNVPLSGPVSDLGVGISGVLITALGQAIVPAASGYMMYALGPYGALAYVGMKLGEKMLEVVLPPVVFAPQETAITDEHVDYLERVGKILNERPETDMQLCPTAASWEFLTPEQREEMAGSDIEMDAADREQLAELGQRRAAAVRDYLAETTGIKRDRLLICETRITAEQDAQPAVLLQM